MPETITLSDALDLIAQSKAEIKTSVQGKGGTINDDLTYYANSIDNIQFRSLIVENEKNLFRYSNHVDLTVEQYLDGNKSFPENLSYVVDGSYVNVNMMTESSGATNQRFRLTPENYGTSYLTIHDDMGNCDYPVTINVPTFDISAEVDSYVGFSSVGNDITTGNLTAEWDTSAQSHTISFTLDALFANSSTAIMPASVVSVVAEGTMIDNNQVTISYAAGVAVNELIITVTPVNDYYNGGIQLTITDGTCDSIFALDFTGGSDAVSGGFSWDGADSNDPIDCLVSSFSDPVTFNINLSCDLPNYNYFELGTWTPDAGSGITSDDNDTQIIIMGDLMSDFEATDNGYFSGPWSEGDDPDNYDLTRSYTLTFNYNIDYSMLTDDVTGDTIDDPDAQALDGTTITFYVHYHGANVGNL